MEVLQSRTDSFKAKRVQNPAKPSSTVSVKWPHPRRFIASPAVLAEAGFYFNPSYEDRDSVTCFYCEKQLSHWEVEDDPFDIHWEKCKTTCCWAIVRCGLRGDMDGRGFISSDKSRLPTSKNMEQARFGTFQVGNGWIHDQVEDHGANSRKMARAGFVWTPQYVNDDLATCLYCEVSLGGWDAEDDPM
ncbi:inhibitor of apoptosis repeat-containing protein [Collybia nuda]|uniref:Inhibitor of apoptosis repeat-containing protein n=1 Tax=Collybia nuda TaxID=64659 RepID=A0A9P5Y9P2_9AGAR|nr:inhibitor of apoptosis repeat-containing protein [Collybia nuda]